MSTYKTCYFSIITSVSLEQRKFFNKLAIEQETTRSALARQLIAEAIQHYRLVQKDGLSNLILEAKAQRYSLPVERQVPLSSKVSLDDFETIEYIANVCAASRCIVVKSLIQQGLALRGINWGAFRSIDSEFTSFKFAESSDVIDLLAQFKDQESLWLAMKIVNLISNK